MIQIKPGVSLVGLKPEVLVAVLAAEGAFAKRDLPLVVTSATDGRHMAGSLHYKGLAFDCRIRPLDDIAAAELRKELQAALGGEFDVVLETDHLHVEFDPKGPVNG